MKITQDKQNDVNVVSLRGRLDAGTSPSLEETLNVLVEAGEAKTLIDCRELDYISSAGLRVLLSSAKQFKKIEGSIILSALNPNVQQVFEISGFTSIFSIYGTRQEALQSFA